MDHDTRYDRRRGKLRWHFVGADNGNDAVVPALVDRWRTTRQVSANNSREPVAKGFSFSPWRDRHRGQHEYVL